MSELVETSKIEAKVLIVKVANGYTVTRRVAGSKEPTGLFEGPETEDYVFSNLADVVKFLGDHYKEPTKGV